MGPPRACVFPVSFSQQRLWLLDRLTPGQASYNVPAAVRLAHAVDRRILQRAVTALVARHESLRTSFVEFDGQPFQVVAARVRVPTEVVDLSSLGADAAMAEAERLVQAEAARPFDLARAPLVRVTLVALAPCDHILLVTCHHAIADGASVEVIFRDLTTLYAAYAAGTRPALPRLPLQFADFAVWQRDTFGGERRDQQLEYWRRELADLPEALSLPADHPRRPEQRFRGSIVPVSLPAVEATRLRALARDADATLFMVLVSGLQALFHRYSGATDIAIGSPVAGRHHGRLDEVVGFFVNTVVLRARLDDDPTVAELIRRVRRTVLDAFANQDLPFEQVVSDLAPRRALSHQPLCQVLFGLQTVTSTEGGSSGDRRIPIDTGTSKGDLTVTLTDNGRDIVGALEYDSDLFERTTVERMRDAWRTLLTGMVADPEARISSLPILSPGEHADVIHRWNDTSRPYPRDTPVHALVGRQVAASPDAVAVRDEDVGLTYRALGDRASALAGRLAAAGVGQADRVGVCLDRSADMVVAWLAILQAGAAYVPLDPGYPPARLAALVADAGTAVVVADQTTRGGLPAHVHVLDVEEQEDTTAPAPIVPPASAVGGDAPAYLVYTSGSTGTPKGAVIPHRAVNRLVLNTNYIEITAADRIAQASNVSFDAATFEVWGTLVNGASLVIVPRDVLLDPHALASFLRTERLSVLFITTALFNQVVAECPDAFATLRCLLTGGEMADAGRFREVLAHGPPASLLHVYGPTETTTFATFFPVERVVPDATIVPIGRPIGNTRAYVVDARLEPVPVGVPGELVIAGDGVALEYFERPGLTAERFIEDRWGLDGRAYRTGDLCRWTAQGQIEILGRLDDQVKIRGFRVEPAEVEAVLAAHPSVSQVVVIPRGEGGATRLVAYVVSREPGAGGAAPSAPPGAATLRAYLRDRVPEYLVPSAIVRLDRLPLTPNGKVDRSALPVPDMRRSVDAAVAPTTPDEVALAAIWADVLRIESVGIHDNFFELGGDSIRAIQVVSRAARAGLKISPRQLFQHQTVAELARVVRGAAGTATPQEPVVGDVPLTPIQRWFLDDPPADPHHFNQAVIIDVPPSTTLADVETVARALVRHHDALRLRVAHADGSWRQWVAPPDETPMVVGYDVGAAEAQVADIARLATTIQASLDLARGPIVRMGMFERGAGLPPWLLIAVHHLAIDLVSWQILLEDFALALDQHGRGTSVALPPKTVSFKEWAERLVAVETGRSPQPVPWSPDDWRSGCGLPVDLEDGDDANVVASCQTCTVSIAEDVTSRLEHRTNGRGDASMPHLVLAALLAALRDWTGRDTFAVDVEGHGRDVLDDEIDVSRTIGWFTAITPVCFTVPTGAADPHALVRHVTERLSATPRGAGHAPGGPIAFNYMGRVERRAPGPDAGRALLTGATRSPRGRRRHLFEIDAGIVGGHLTVHWTYSAALHRHDTIARLASGMSGTLRSLAALHVGVPVPSAIASTRDASADRTDTYPLSPLQEGMLFHALDDPRGGHYVVLTTVPVATGLDVPRFRAAWDAVIAHNPILRTAFVWEGLDTPRQVVCSAVGAGWDIQDWRGLRDDEVEPQLREYLERERRAGFDVARAPLMRFALLRVSDEEWRFVWVCHHLLLDGWSRPLVLADAAEAYDALGRGVSPQLPARRPYRDYIAWLEGRDRDAADRFWRARLAGVREATPMLAALPVDPGREGRVMFATQWRALSAESTARLDATLRRHQVTLSTAIHGAWALLLGCYTRRADVVFGSTVSGRPASLEGVEQMIGPFINTIPARVRIAYDEATGAWLRTVQDELTAAREFEDASLVRTRACSEVPRGAPLFESLVVVENYPGTGETATQGSLSSEWTNYPLTVSAVPGRMLRVEITHAARIGRQAVAGLLDQLIHLIEAVAGSPDLPVRALPTMSAAERHRVLVAWNDTEARWPGTSVHGLVRAWARQHPDAEAVACGARRLTYGALVREATGAVARLGRAGVRAGDFVGIFLDRSLELPVAMLAVGEAGAAYVCLDTRQPRERVSRLLEDASVSVVLTRRELVEALKGLPVRVVLLDDADRSDDAAGEAWPAAPLDLASDSPAYVVYTSGSTGVPKGVAVSHGAVLNHARAVQDRYALQPSDRVLQFASPAFDVAAEEIVPTLASGATLVVWPEPLAPTVAELMAFSEAGQLTLLNLPTPFWHEWVDDLERGNSRVPACVRAVVVGTDRASPEAVARWMRLVPARVRWFNAYGCTETTITSTTYEPPRQDVSVTRRPVPIGRPIANTRAYVVDPRLEPVAVGVPGELVIAGAGVALGYLNRPAETADRFIAERWREGGGRAYRTGDLARWSSDGTLELIGRIDDQLKVRGYRIEPAEIAAVLVQHEAVRQAAVVGQEHQDERRLVAYVVSETPADVDDLRAFLRDRLPAYMVPAAFVHVAHLPVTVNGKLDRAALPPASFERGERDRIEPRDDRERTVAAIWAAALGVTSPGVHDNFFDLGGHSLIATRVASRIRQAFGVDVPLRMVFDHPTIAAFASALGQAVPDTQRSAIAPRSGAGPCPLSFPQERLWFLDQLAPGTPLYNMPCSLHIDGPLDLGAMQASLDLVVQRHESLRTTFALVDGGPVQLVAPSAVVPSRIVDLTGVDEARRNEEAIRAATLETRRPFDLRKGPLIRAAILRLREAEHVLVTTMHHIVSDGWSVGVLLRELQAGYEAFSLGKAPRLRELPIQYPDYAVWQRAWLQGDVLEEQLAYWRRHLAGAPAAIELPTDRPRPPQRRFRGAYDVVALPRDVTAAIGRLGRQEGVTLFMIVLAAWQLVLSRWSGQDEVLVGTPVAGRHRAETEDLIGFFLNNLVMRTSLAGDPEFRDLLARVREVALAGFARQDVPFERLLADLAPARDASRTPIFQVFLNVLTFDEERMQLPTAVAESFSLAGGRASGASGQQNLDVAGTAEAEPEVWSQFDLTLYAGERDGRLRFVLVYDTDLFDRPRMAEMLDQLGSVLEQATTRPEQPLSAFDLTTERARRLLPDAGVPLDETWRGSVAHLLSERAQANPGRLAVDDGTDRVTYQEIDARSSQIAHALQAVSVGRGDIVAVYAARSASLPWALLGIMKAGAAFMVLDPRYPATRLEAHVALAHPKAVIHLDAAGPMPPGLQAAFDASDVACLRLPSFRQAALLGAFEEYSVDAPSIDCAADDVACIGFTSGSTGAPKGIVGRHGSLTHFVPWLARTFRLGADDRFSVLSGLSHDPLQRELFTPLSLGATAVVPPAADYAEPARLARWVASSGATVAHLTPALGQLLVQGATAAGRTVRLPALRVAFFVGDVLRMQDVLRLTSVAPSLTCVNYYGTTETQRAVGYTVVPVPREASGSTAPASREEAVIPLGRGVEDVQLLVLGASGRVCGIGELGEIHVRSPHLAAGYLGDPALTADRFLVNPGGRSERDRMYRTGDLGRYLPDGQVAFAGRRDLQVKIRGFRVEPTEIEAVLAGHPAVKDAKVVAREDPGLPRQLVAYVVPAGDRPLQVTDLRSRAVERLPAYMVPAHIVVIPALPVTPNGKLDYAALPPAEVRIPRGLEPRTPLEAQVAALWRELPGVSASDVRAGFFESGGHSLLSAVLLARVRERLGVTLEIAEFFRAPTIAGLAAAIETARVSRARPTRPVVRLARAGYAVDLTTDGRPLRLPVALAGEVPAALDGA